MSTDPQAGLSSSGPLNSQELVSPPSHTSPDWSTPAGTAAAGTTTDGSAAAPDNNPAARVAIGTQRAGVAAPRAKSQIPSKAVEPTKHEKVVVPNVRHRFAPEIELAVAEAMGEFSLEAAFDTATTKEAANIVNDTRMRGTVLQIHNDDVFVDLRGKSQGVMSLRQFKEPPEIGAEVDIIVDRFNNEEGLYLVRLPTGTVDVGDWSDITEGMIVEARVTGHNKGGLECEVKNLRGFIPAGQVSPYRIEDLSTLVGEKLACVVTECNPARRNLVLSRRAVLEREKEEAKEKLWAELAEGQVREGTVRSLQDFGAFVDLGGADGLIHISQMSWKRIRHPNELLKVGDMVKVLIRKIDQETRKIGLTLRDLTENPWTNAAAKYPVTSEVQGVVTRIMEFGAFVELEPGVEGLVHISELSHSRVFRVGDFIKVGDKVTAKVMSLDLESQRIGLSMKALQQRPESNKKKAETEVEVEEPAPEPIVATHKELKGGVERPMGGDRFGLKW